MEKELNQDFNPEIELLQPIPEDKFDTHMEESRKTSMKARRTVFMNQYETTGNRSEKYGSIKPSIY